MALTLMLVLLACVGEAPCVCDAWSDVEVVLEAPRQHHHHYAPRARVRNTIVGAGAVLELIGIGPVVIESLLVERGGVFRVVRP